MTLLVAEGLQARRGRQVVLDGVDFSISAGERVAIVGPSGSGKTTLLSVLSGLVRPDAGTVSLDGTELHRLPHSERSRVALVLQGYGLVGLLDATENVEIALRAAEYEPAEAMRIAAEALAEVGLTPYADHLVEELSGGQQQRTAVARALALQPDVMVADEPTAEQDPASREIVLDRLLGVTDRGGALVLATHDPEVAIRCDRVIRLEDGRAQQSE
jgi:heme ABC exporter ATP-binding subunit CcmA